MRVEPFTSNHRVEGVVYLLSRALRFYRKNGLLLLIKTAPGYLYRRIIRPNLPKKDSIVEYNGVKVQPYRYGDDFSPFDIPVIRDNTDDYEAELIKQIRGRVLTDDTVVVIGGGLGVSSVTAAIQASDGRVITYEGASEYAKTVAQTAEINDVEERVSIDHAIVGEPISLEGEAGDAPVVNPRNLPDCDVLVTDCEGAEELILENLRVQPRELIVETHGNRRKVEDLIQRNGYRIQSCEFAELPPLEDMARENGVYVIGAVLEKG